MQYIGVDFGTTNSVVSLLDAEGVPQTLRFAIGGRELEVFRTILCFWLEEAQGGEKLRQAAGPAAIDAYLEDSLGSRLIMSMKTYLAQRSFTDTRIFNRIYTLETLVSTFLRALLGGIGTGEKRVVAGRPVRFAGDAADDALGEDRLRAGFAAAGFPDIEVALEPEGAGYKFVRGLTAPATVLIGDFGGGTSDFSLLRFEPGASQPITSLGYAGIGLAGDTFDYRIIDQVISPLLGKNDTYTVMGKVLPMPGSYFSGFAHWHKLSLMRTPRILRDIEETARGAANPARLRALIQLIEDEVGYELYQTISAAKAALSSAETVPLRFCHRDFAIDTTLARRDFESWIAGDLGRISATVETVLAAASLTAAEVDHVFLTGGTSFVPAMRRIFADKFGLDKLSSGAEFVSVAEGLALIGLDRAKKQRA